MSIRLNLIFALSLFLQPLALAQDHCKLSESVQTEIDNNTFMIVPLNAYAATLPEERARQIYQDECQKQNLSAAQSMNCEIFKLCKGEACRRSYLPNGTAFLLGEGDSLYTAWHVTYQTHAAALFLVYGALENYSEEKRNQTFLNMSPNFVLLNQVGEVVYDTREELPGETKYKHIGDPLATVYNLLGKKDEKAFGFFENAPVDFVNIRLSRKMGTGLTLYQGALKGNECFFTAGFAYDGQKTQYSSIRGQATDIMSLYSNLNKVIPFQLHPLPISRSEFESLELAEQMRRMGYAPDVVEQYLKQYSTEVLLQSIKASLDFQARHMRDLRLEANDRVLFFDAPALTGHSGAPVFLNTGEIAGLTTNAFMKINSETGIHSSVGGVALVLREALENPIKD